MPADVQDQSSLCGAAQKIELLLLGCCASAADGAAVAAHTPEKRGGISSDAAGSHAERYRLRPPRRGAGRSDHDCPSSSAKL